MNKSLQPKRQTNLELLRIIAMLLIIVHHYVVNSELLSEGGPVYAAATSPTSLVLLCLGAFGKTAINCFVLITGYFMCVSSISAKKFAKLYLEVVFYRVVISGIFWLSGYAPFSLLELFHCVFPMAEIKTNFAPAFLVFFLFLPFLKLLTEKLTQKQHFYLLLLSCFVYVFMGTVKHFFIVSMNYLTWFCVLFLVASYIRLYPNRIFDSARIWGICSLIGVMVCIGSVLVCTYVGERTGMALSYLFVVDSNTFLAFFTGLSGFLFFKNVRIPHCPSINTLAGSCFGIFLIHANSETMRRWLWVDVLNNAGMYASPWLPLHILGSVLAIFFLCAGIDLLRRQLLEKPFFRLWDKHFPPMSAVFSKKEAALLHKLHIRKDAE